jgi:hypothetical protein
MDGVRGVGKKISETNTAEVVLRGEMDVSGGGTKKEVTIKATNKEMIEDHLPCGRKQ